MLVHWGGITELDSLDGSDENWLLFHRFGSLLAPFNFFVLHEQLKLFYLSLNVSVFLVRRKYKMALSEENHAYASISYFFGNFL